MKKLLAGIVFCFCFQFSFGQNISILFASPKPRGLAIPLEDSILSVAVIISSTYPIDSVTANVSGRQTSLAYDLITGHYEGTLNLSGLPQDTLTCQVTVTDVQNNQKTANQAFIYALPPQLIIESPVSMSTATPLIHIKAKCTGSANCTLNVTAGNLLDESFNPLSINFGASVDTFIDLSTYEGRTGNLVFTAISSVGQSISVARQIFVEGSPYLTPVFAGNDEIFDFNYNKVLISNPTANPDEPDLNPYVYRSRIVNILTGDSTYIPGNYPVVSGQPFTGYSSQLTSYGAIFTTQDTVTFLPSLFDWNADSVYTLATNTGVAEKVVGNNAIWVKDTLLYLRNLQTASNSLVAVSGLADLGANGVVTYMSNDYNIYRFANNTSTLLTNNAGNLWNTNPVTDGNYIAYTKTAPCCNAPNVAIHLNTGSSDTLLSTISTPPYVAIPFSYLVNNKFTAYSKPDTAGNLQIWLRDSSGANAQKTFFNNSCSIEFLNPTGDVVFTREVAPFVSRRYFVSRSTGQVSEIGSSLGQVFYRDSSWYLAIGRMLYKIDLQSIPNAVLSTVIPVDSVVYPFAATDFIRNFTGFAALTNVMITSLPARGTLKLNGADVSVNAQISKDSLNQLTYTPNAGVTGIDSFTWNGFNGSTYTPGTATIALNIGPSKPPQPLISGMNNGYCSTMGTQKIKILNLPDSGAGDSVWLKLDSSSRSIAPDSSFSFNVSSLTVGAHAVQLSYSNAIGSVVLTDSFQVTAAVTPDVKIFSNVSTATGLVDPVIITATNVSGGGAAPLYTFAGDRNMSTVLQSEGTANTLTISPVTLAIGNNWIYVRMRTSDSCYTVQTSLDSVQVVRNTVSGIIDPDFPAQPINIFPNPFVQSIVIDGLSVTKTYLLTIHNAIGETVYQQQVSNGTAVTLNQPALPTGSYWLSIYDVRKNKLIGVTPVFKK
jgi:hypothetical protein